MQLFDKIAIVTGASSGIGKEFSRALIDKGAIVYGLARRSEKLSAVQNELGESFRPVQMDVTDHDRLEQWTSDTFSANTHRPDILINNAGLAKFGEVDRMSLEDWHSMIDTNLNGIFYLTRLIVPLMKQHPDVCHIINISSIAGLLGNPEISGYNASKFAVRGFSEALFKELRYDGIKVSCMFPGSIATDFFKTAMDGDTHPNMMMPEDVAATLIHLLETPDNHLINEVTMRPLNPKPPENEA
ncbi:MAG: SDR family oxidoreductase [Balneolaceae bacterium]